jgi:predicted membrane channel-forming protein YqfA (hemolysin III family)
MTEQLTAGKRAIAGVAFAVLLVCAANYYLEWHAFGRFDKSALVLSIAGVAGLVPVLSRSMPKRRPTFSWHMFAGIVAIVVGVCAWVGWRAYVKERSGGFESLEFLVLPATLVIFLARRWRLLRRELADGTFSDERYHANPGEYMMGPLRERILWLIV